MKTIIVCVLLALVGCKKDEPKQTTEIASASVAVAAANGDPVKVTADEKGFTPAKVEVKKGQALNLDFVRTTDKTCADKVVFPDLGITKDLPLNTPVRITVPTDTARTLTFQCGMGMFKSSVVVNAS